MIRFIARQLGGAFWRKVGYLLAAVVFAAVAGWLGGCAVVPGRNDVGGLGLCPKDAGSGFCMSAPMGKP